MNNNINFIDYYNKIIFELKKNKSRDQNYFDNLDMLIKVVLSKNDFTELEKVARLRDLVYSNGSLSKEQLKNIDKELGYEKYYEENCR